MWKAAAGAMSQIVVEKRHSPCEAPTAPIRARCDSDDVRRAGARIAQTRDGDPPVAQLAVPDRHLSPRLPDIELAELARPIDRPLNTRGGPLQPVHRHDVGAHQLPIGGNSMSNAAAARLDRMALRET